MKQDKDINVNGKPIDSKKPHAKTGGKPWNKNKSHSKGDDGSLDYSNGNKRSTGNGKCSPKTFPGNDIA